MLERRPLFAIAAGMVLLPVLATAQPVVPANAKPPLTSAPTAPAQLLTLGPEAQALAKRVGV